MMQNSYFIDYLEDCIKGNTFPDEPMKAASKMSRYNRERSLFKEGDVKDINSTDEMKEWGKIRLSAFGSMAIFFLYGAAGWWHCLPDSHNFNQRDVWSLVHLAHARHEWLYERRRLKDRRTDNTPWYQIDSFVRWLLRNTNMDCLVPSEVDWESAPRFWAQHVNEKNVSRLALEDIMAEVCKVQPTKTMNCKGDEAPDVKIRRPSKEYAEEIKYNLKRAWTPMIDAHHHRVEDEVARVEEEAARVEEEAARKQESQQETRQCLGLPEGVRKPRSKTESDEDEEEDGDRSSLPSNPGKLKSKKSSLDSTSSSEDEEDESSGTDPNRASSEDIPDNVSFCHRR
ncbi:Golgi to ER traffic- protein [Puccinia graminis f. sp. tritici]|uniref:Golgi to ER traffic-protein n=1 Tax=Puccinia graminis f. sp. tritici TaxID=56615 RepID=A0A5B0M8U5_PUCGR|nr:Golgi to ER traffic- protein [Puccinia graminis f. sp. tritici]